MSDNYPIWGTLKTIPLSTDYQTNTAQIVLTSFGLLQSIGMSHFRELDSKGKPWKAKQLVFVR